MPIANTGYLALWERVPWVQVEQLCLRYPVEHWIGVRGTRTDPATHVLPLWVPLSALRCLHCVVYTTWDEYCQEKRTPLPWLDCSRTLPELVYVCFSCACHAHWATLIKTMLAVTLTSPGVHFYPFVPYSPDKAGLLFDAF